MSIYPSESSNPLLAQIDQAKLEWETTVDALPQIVCLMNKGGYILRANRAVERWGYGRVQEVIGRALHELMHPRCNDPDCALNVFWCKAWSAVMAGQPAEAEIDDVQSNRCLYMQVNPLRHVRQTELNGLNSFAAVIVHDVTERKRVEQERERLLVEVRADREQLQALSRRMLHVQEEERRSIARELHDDIGQDLTAVKINLQTAEPLAQAALAYIEDSIRIVERTLQQIRNLSLELRPSMLDDLGLIPALRWYTNRAAQRAGLEIEFLNHLGDIRLPPEIETTCFRVVQAALTNTIKHAQAKHVSICLRRNNGEVSLIIRDDGVGFDVNAARQAALAGASLGILSMEERVSLVGGRINIESTLGHGTEIRALFPHSESSP
ncbi:MAG: histidine kinase [Anaerolineae bacterium]|nr:histidine kinase [Thermoflexales bacterium]MDW8408068.1 histidine kinase [Anaerolineae bacterium]